MVGLFGGKRRGERKEWRGVGGRIPTGKEGRNAVAGAGVCQAPPPHCAIALWLKIAVDELLRRRRENRKTPGGKTHAARGGGRYVRGWD